METTKSENSDQILFKAFIEHKPDKEWRQQLAEQNHIALNSLCSLLTKYAYTKANREERKRYEQIKPFYSIRFDFYKIEYAYDYLKNLNWECSEIEEMAKKFNIRPLTLVKYLEMYATHILNINNLSIDIKTIKKAQTKVKTQKLDENETNIIKSLSKPFQKLYNQVLMATNDQEIIHLCYCFDPTGYKIKNYIKSYSNYLYKTSDDKSIDYFNKTYDIFNPYFVYLKEKKKDKNNTKEESLKRAREIITDFINSGLSRSQYYLKTHRKTYAYANILKEEDSNLFNLYLDAIENTISEDCVNEINTLLYYIKNGIIENNIKRKCDVIDYYLIVKSPLGQIRTTMDKLLKRKLLTIEDYKTIILFQHVNRLVPIPIQNVLSFWYSTKVDVESKLNERIEYGIVLDQNGYPIPGSGKVITEEEKNAIFDFCEENNIVCDNRVYYAGITRIKNGVPLNSNTKTFQFKKAH